MAGVGEVPGASEVPGVSEVDLAGKVAGVGEVAETRGVPGVGEVALAGEVPGTGEGPGVGEVPGASGASDLTVPARACQRLGLLILLCCGSDWGGGGERVGGDKEGEGCLNPLCRDLSRWPLPMAADAEEPEKGVGLHLYEVLQWNPLYCLTTST